MKLESKQTHVKIPLSSLKITTNVRTDFDQDDIAALAKSIKENGLVNAITVKPPVTDENGVKIYEVIAGGRRVRAHQWLCDHGDDFSMIDAKILTGDLWTLQMIENIQRTDLSQREKENAIKEALEKGMTQKEIADRLSKPISYVSDILAGSRVREVAEKAGQNTDGISTKALAQLRGIEPKVKVQAVKKLKERGGTVAAATQILRESKSEKIEAPDIVEEKPKKKKAEKKPRRFNIYVKPNNRLDMMGALGQLKVYIQDLELGTKICVQAGNDIADVSSIIYEPENNRVVFRSLDSVFSGGKK